MVVARFIACVRLCGAIRLSAEPAALAADSPAGRAPAVAWSSTLAIYLGTAGASVGLGSIWRFPYLAGTGGGSAFILVFVLACVLVATPLLVAEFSLGRASRLSPPEAAGAVAVSMGRSSRWNAIGILGTVGVYLIFSYYTVIAAWILAYAWKCGVGILSAAGPQHVADVWATFQANPLEAIAWHAGFVAIVILISARGLQGGIEPANKIRAPALLTLLLILVIYALATGNVRRGLSFAFKPDFSAINAQVVLSAIGQAFYATGVGQAMMIAFGAYMQRGTSLVRASLVITASIVLVSLLATMMIFPLVFGYGMNPAQGPALVFDVLPRVFTEMPGGRLIGTLFFSLLVLAALTPSMACLEAPVAWLVGRGFSRPAAVWMVGVSSWLIGIGTILSFNVWSGWHPLGFIPLFAHKTFFDVLDYVCSNIALPVGALLTSILVGWRLSSSFADGQLMETTPFARIACVWLLRYVCPVAILAVFVATLI
jgi:NSS family neurotransmitter:Na+ symporter